MYKNVQNVVNNRNFFFFIYDDLKLSHHNTKKKIKITN